MDNRARRTAYDLHGACAGVDEISDNHGIGVVRTERPSRGNDRSIGERVGAIGQCGHARNLPVRLPNHAIRFHVGLLSLWVGLNTQALGEFRQVLREDPHGPYAKLSQSFIDRLDTSSGG